MDKLIFINGEACDSINVLDRGLLFGDSVYEVTRSQESKLIYLDYHLGRLENSANRLYYPKGIIDEVRSDIEKITPLYINKDDYYLRIIITRGIDKNIGLIPDEDTKPNRILILQKFTPYPERWYKEGISLCVSSIKRNHPEGLNPDIKSGNYLNNYLALSEAKRRGFDDALMLSQGLKLTESTTSNIWFVKGNTFYTPSLDNGLLAGITRSRIISIIQAHPELELVEGSFDLEQIKDADEIFVSSSTKELIPVNKLEDKVFNVSEQSKTNLIAKLYREQVRADHQL